MSTRRERCNPGAMRNCCIPRPGTRGMAAEPSTCTPANRTRRRRPEAYQTSCATSIAKPPIANLYLLAAPPAPGACGEPSWHIGQYISHDRERGDVLAKVFGVHLVQGVGLGMMPVE